MESDGATKVGAVWRRLSHGSPGGLFMAHAILTGLNAPALVSDVEIDVAGGTGQAQACTVENVKAQMPSGVAFDRTDEALPLPVQGLGRPAAVRERSEGPQLVRPQSDRAGPGQVRDSPSTARKSASYTAEQLAAGVNLGNLTTGPILEQGQQVFDAINAKNRFVHQRFRGVVMFPSPDWLADVVAERKPKELAKRMDKITPKQAEIYKLVQPTTHRFELKSAK